MRTALFLFLIHLAHAVVFAASPVRIEVLTDREYYREDTRENLFFWVRVIAGPAPESVTAPRNIAVVLDRSGSMVGPPAEAADQGTAALMARLQPTDTFSVIAFGSSVSVLREAAPAASALDFPLSGESMGGSALYDALNQAAAQLRRHATPQSLNHLILLSDGPPTKGPRDAADFEKLAQALARENITVSTIGYGEECPEDLLAQLARQGHGNFQFVQHPGQIGAAMLNELPPVAALIGRDAELSITLDSSCEEVEAHGWIPTQIKDQVITCALPRLLSGAECSLLASLRFFPGRFSTDVATVQLKWRDPQDGREHVLKQKVTIEVTADSRASKESARAPVLREAAQFIVADALQDAIEQLDKNDPRRALRLLRGVRSDLNSLNYELDDPEIKTTAQQLEAYLNTLQARPLNALDRKVLRSGLGGQFQIPMPAAKP